MKYIAGWSGGKDSTASIIIAMRHGEPLREVIYCEVMFDKKVSGEIPEHREFIRDVAIPKLESWGIKVVVLRSDFTYVDSFKRIIKRGRLAGRINSFPLCGRCCIQRDCKAKPLDNYKKTLPNDVIHCLGYASDEEERLLRLEPTKTLSLLEKHGVPEADTFDICRSEGLLSPIYQFTNRGGCWFCPNAKEKELRHLYDHHPDLWQRMLELQALPNKATELFNRRMRFSDIDENFRIDDLQISLW